MQVVILAGGKGSRMGSLAENLPKPMLPLAGKPLLEHQIELARRFGIEEAILLTGHRGDVIQEHFGDGSKWGMKIRCHRETQPLGTAGAVKEIQSWLRQDFLVFYGDVVMDIDLAALLDFHAARQALATLVVHPNGHPWDSDLLELDPRQKVVAFHPKPHEPGRYYRNLVNAALYVLSPRALDAVVPGQYADLGRSTFPELVRRGQAVYGYNTAEYLVDVGTIERLHKVEQDFLSGKLAQRNRRQRRRAVFLDRDGVLNVEVDHVCSAEALELLPGAAAAVRRINEAGLLAVVASNQPALAKGFLSADELERIHAKLETLLGREGAYLDRIYVCPHHPEKGFPGERAELKVACACRKPSPGMLLAAAGELNIDLAASFMVGDRTPDIEAGARAGCKTILVRTGYGGHDGKSAAVPDFVCDDLAAAVEWALAPTVQP